MKPTILNGIEIVFPISKIPKMTTEKRLYLRTGPADLLVFLILRL